MRFSELWVSTCRKHPCTHGMAWRGIAPKTAGLKTEAKFKVQSTAEHCAKDLWAHLQAGKGKNKLPKTWYEAAVL